ncbi:MAG: protein kinase [Chloroflexota bacterium]
MATSDLDNSVLGNYRLNEVLGIGGMGIVYRARQLNLNRDVAVKVLSPQLAQQTGYIDRFTREAHTAASLEHAHIVPVYDYGVQDDTSYVAMRMLLGGSLTERIKYRQERGLPLPSLPEISLILAQAASALDYAHEKGVIHRDVKPSNMMFDQQGSVYVVDFGIAKLMASGGSVTHTGLSGTNALVTGSNFFGTPVFMAPEQWKGQSPTPAIDQYALGGVLYMMITGNLPFEADVAFALMNKHLEENPADVKIFRPNAPAQINDVIQRAMAKKPEDRYPSNRAFAQAFAAVIHETAAETATEFTTFPLPPRRQISVPNLTPSRSTNNAIPSATSPDKSREPTAAARPTRNLLSVALGGLGILIALALIAFIVSRQSNPEKPLAQVLEITFTTTPSLTPVIDTTAQPAVVVNQPEATSTPSETLSPMPTETLRPTDTLAPTDTLTFTLTASLVPSATTGVAAAALDESQPFARVLRNVKVYTRPATSASVLYTLPPDAIVNVVGISTDDLWLQIPLPDGGFGWITAAQTIVRIEGSIANLPVIAPPTSTLTPSFTVTASDTPTATQTFTNTPTQTSTSTTIPTATPSDTMTVTSSLTPSFTPSLTVSSTSSFTPSSMPSFTPSSTPSLTPSSTPSSTGTSTLETPVLPCTVRTNRVDVAVHVGPGENRPVRGRLPAYTDIPVTGQVDISDGSVWWRVQPPGALTELDRYWVAETEVDESGACEDVQQVSSSPIIRVTPTSVPTAIPTVETHFNQPTQQSQPEAPGHPGATSVPTSIIPTSIFPTFPPPTDPPTFPPPTPCC